MSEEELEEYLRDRTGSLEGHVGIYCQELATGKTMDVVDGKRLGDRPAEEDVFESASVIKIWIMAAAYDLMAKGKLSPDEILTLKDIDKVPFVGDEDYARDQARGQLTEDMFPESGVLNAMHPGLELTVEDTIRLMILISDNTATNMMIDLVGLDVVNNFLNKMGMSKSRLCRRLFDSDPSGMGQENSISLSETGWFFRQLYDGTLVSAEASEKMSSMMQNQQTTYKIPFFLREIPIAHKTGEDCGIANDVGIVFAKNPFIFCFASNGVDVAAADRLCQDAALEVYNYYNV
ncbi:MAG: serine hydrolase [Clostridiales bacterium]|nr:serine hydrolase [Clostridiales bacterium]